MRAALVIGIISMKLFFVGVASLGADQFFELFEGHALASELTISLWDDDAEAGRSLMINGHSTLVRPIKDAQWSDAELVVLAAPDIELNFVAKLPSNATVIDLYSNMPDDQAELVIAGRDTLLKGTYYRSAEPVLLATYRFCEAVSTKLEPLRIHMAATLPASIHDREGVEALARETASLLNGIDSTQQFLDATLAFNALAQPVSVNDSGESPLEALIADGASQIFEDAEVSVSTVQVPMFHGTSVMLTMECQDKPTLKDLVPLIDRSPVLRYSLSTNASTQMMIGQSECLVSRVRVDPRVDQTLHVTLMFDEQRFGRAANLLDLLATLVTKH